MKRVLINAANLHKGGGVQVASSFIEALSRMYVHCGLLHVLASTEVDRELRALNANIDAFGRYELVNVYGIAGSLSVKRYLGYDVVFTVFGPFYGIIKSGIHLVGFAQPWILFPDNEISRSMSPFKRMATSVKFALQWRFFTRSDCLVVELEHIKSTLVRDRRFPTHRVDVVHNCFSPVYLDRKLWAPVCVHRPECDFMIGYVGRDYPHKNLSVLPKVGLILKERYKLVVCFAVTLTEDEWTARRDSFGDYVVNVGALSVPQCPSFYELLDAVIFPSLLECFSATPLEAMVMRRPLFASDRGFIRDVCAEDANYFDPLDPESIAYCIFSFFSRPYSERCNMVESARNRVLSFSSSDDRTRHYIGVMNSLGADLPAGSLDFALNGVRNV